MIHIQMFDHIFGKSGGISKVVPKLYEKYP